MTATELLVLAPESFVTNTQCSFRLFLCSLVRTHCLNPWASLNESQSLLAADYHARGGQELINSTLPEAHALHRIACEAVPAAGETASQRP